MEDNPESPREAARMFAIEQALGDAVPSKTWEVSAFDRVNNEWTTTVNRAYDHQSAQQLSDFISQADPVRITPDKRRPANRDHKLIVAFSDSQIDYRQINDVLFPLHDERALGVVRMVCRDLQPETVINLGDTLDLASLSRFPADSNHFNHSMQPAINRVHRLYAELRADNPSSRIIEVDSNHNTRLRKFVLKNFPQIDLLQQAGTEGQWPVLSYPYLVNLDAVGVEWISGYGAAEYVYGEEYDTPPIVFKHGTTVVSNNSTAAKESKLNPETHVVRGHGHRAETHHRTSRSGQYLASIMVGATCSIEGAVPSYHSAVNDRGEVVKQYEDWQQSLLVIEDYQGEYNFIHIPIHNGVANFNGKRYQSE